MMLRVAHDLKCCSAAGLGERESPGGCSSWVHGLTGLGRAPRASPWAVRGGCLMHCEAAMCCGRGGRAAAAAARRAAARRPEGAAVPPFPHKPAPIDASWLLKRNGYS